MRKQLVLVCLLAACGSDSAGGGDDMPPPDADTITPVEGDPLAGLPTGPAQWSALCGKHYGDMISAKFCAGATPPSLTSLADLESLLGLSISANPQNNTNVKFTLVSESVGIGMRHVTGINPRAFLMTPPNGTSPNPSYQVMAFSRGEPFVELVANDPNANTLRFFLVRFKLACEPNCKPGDLLTPAIESNWQSYTLYDDETIKNTTLDCNTCHQAGGPGTKKILRMQELANPWGHWFYPERPQTLQVVRDFQAAHGNEPYAGIPAALVEPSRPFVLMLLAQNNGFAQQPNAYDTLKINTEMQQGGQSPSWDALYAKAVAGTAIPVPYFMTPHTNPTKVQTMISAYQQFTAGTLPADQLPDINDTVDDTTLPYLSVRPQAGLDGAGILKHMCRMCHNSSLDQSQTRALFDIDKLATLPRAEKDAAIARLMLPDADAHHMPPTRFHELSTAERDAVIAELMK
jgi:hypothetical protein